jgi:hypothetical protein
LQFQKRHPNNADEVLLIFLAQVYGPLLLGAHIQAISADLLEAARRRNLLGNSLAAYEAHLDTVLAWAAAAGFDRAAFLFLPPWRPIRFLGEGKNAVSLKQIRAALSFVYKQWDLKNRFAKIEPLLHKEPQIRYALGRQAAGIDRCLALG